MGLFGGKKKDEDKEAEKQKRPKLDLPKCSDRVMLHSISHEQVLTSREYRLFNRK